MFYVFSHKSSLQCALNLKLQWSVSSLKIVDICKLCWIIELLFLCTYVYISNLQFFQKNVLFCLFCSSSANNVGSHRRQISDLLDQSIQISSQCFVITADNRFILLCGFWDKSFRVYSTDTGMTSVHLIARMTRVFQRC